MRRLVIPFLFASAIVLPAQSQQMPRKSETVDVSIVNVDVVVTDRHGNRVHGLTADDFEIREERQLRPITNFAEYGPSAASTPEVKGNAGASADRRVIILLVDRFSLPEFFLLPLFDGLRSMVHATVKPGDAVMIVSWDRLPVRRLAFTDDLAAIDATLSRVEDESSYRHGYYSAASMTSREWLERTASTATGRDVDFSDIDRFLDEQATRMVLRDKYATLRSLIESVAGVEGRKAMIMVTTDLALYSGRRSDPRNDLTPELESVVRAANGNDVALYPLYPFATPENSLAVGRRPAGRGELLAGAELADKTGGRMDWHPGGIAKMLPDVAKDIDDYYSLAFKADARGDDRARKIVVTAKNAAYRVRTRESYVDKSDETRMSERVVATLLDPAQPAPSRLALTASAGAPRRSSKGLWLIPISVQIPVNGLYTEPNGDKNGGSFSVFIASQSVAGGVTDVTRKQQRFTLTADQIAANRGEKFTYDFELLADSRTERISVGVFDELSRDYGLAVVQLPRRTD